MNSELKAESQKNSSAEKSQRSPLMVIFTTVFLDLVGFGMIIPLVGIYGRHFQASPLQLALLGSIYSVMQFLFAPLWGRWSDQIGRRPILLISLLGSTLSYLGFGFSHSIEALILTRAFAGVFAANISTAQAYIADITTPENRAKGMGLIGASFGIGFTLGPPLGGISASYWGLSAPGFIAGTLCFLNFILAVFRLKESLPKESRRIKPEPMGWGPLSSLASLKETLSQSNLKLPLLTYFFATFAFSNLEQVFSLLIQTRFSLATEEAGMKTGFVLMWSGILGAIIQGGLIRKWVPKYGEVKLITAGLFIQGLAMIFFSQSPIYSVFFLTAIPLAFGSGILNPSLASYISRNASMDQQGQTLGGKEAFGSLARIFGPFCGILAFEVHPTLPFFIAGLVVIFLSLIWKNSKA